MAQPLPRRAYQDYLIVFFQQTDCDTNRKRKGWATMKVWEESVIVRLVSKCIKSERIMRKWSRNITLSEVYFEKYFLWRSNCCCIPPWKDTAGVWGNNNVYSLCCLQQQLQHSAHSEREMQQQFTNLSLPLDIKWAIKVVPTGSLPEAKRQLSCWDRKNGAGMQTWWHLWR